jgi:hypothetical protein
MADKNILQFPELLKKNKEAAAFYSLLKYALDNTTVHTKLLSAIARKTEKKAMELMEYQHVQSGISRSPREDRVFPLDTVVIKQFNTGHDADIEKAVIHYGPNSDEYARSMNALAVTIANDIYFRYGAYRPETEEGRSVLAHELTHVRQHEEKRITPNTTKKELEDEAETEEKKEAFNPDPDITISLRGKLFTFPKSKADMIAQQAAENVIQRLEEAKTTMTEQAYLEMLADFEEKIQAGTTEWLS